MVERGKPSDNERKMQLVLGLTTGDRCCPLKLSPVFVPKALLPSWGGGGGLREGRGEGRTPLKKPRVKL